MRLIASSLLAGLLAVTAVAPAFADRDVGVERRRLAEEGLEVRRGGDRRREREFFRRFHPSRIDRGFVKQPRQQALPDPLLRAEAVHG